MSGKLRMFSGFAGIGGIELGFQRALGTGNIEIIAISEVNKYAIKVYGQHFPDRINFGDIKKIKAENLPDFDIFCGGFPCQDISIAGKRAGLQGARSGLFFEIIRLIREKKPRIIFLENVKGILSSNRGWDFARILLELDELGYSVEWQCINSANHGLAQNRKRVFIIGYPATGRGSKPEIFPLEENDSLHNLQRADETKLHEISICLTSGGNDKWNGTYIAHTLTGGGHSGGLHSSMTLVGHTRDERGNATYHKVDIANTLKQTRGNQSNYLKQGTRIRRLTPIECERLQGFPDNWTDGISDTQRFKCLGNAVAVPVVEAIVNRMHEVGWI